jgi:hypothetical protein
MRRLLAQLILFLCCSLTADARPSRVERTLVAVKADLMSADYRADLPALAEGRLRAAALSDDPKLGYLADYWSGFASWRIVLNGASGNLTPDEAKGHLAKAVIDFESSINKKGDFADAYAGAAAVHGWLAGYSRSDPTTMNKEIDNFKRLINRALELEPNNPRVLWIQAIPYRVMPPERGGSIDRAIELYRKMVENSGPPKPRSPLPDWGKPEGLMSLANAHLFKPAPDINAATEEARAALELQPQWHYVKDILVPKIEAKRKQQ